MPPDYLWWWWLGGNAAMTVTNLWLTRSYWRRERAGEVWHGRCLHLQRVIDALVVGDKAEARRLIREAGDRRLMASLGAADPAEKS
jgi:hypothetical protein